MERTRLFRRLPENLATLIVSLAHHPAEYEVTCLGAPRKTIECRADERLTALFSQCPLLHDPQRLHDGMPERALP